MEKLCGPYIDRRAWEKEPGYEARLEYHHTTGVLHVQFNLGFFHTCKNVSKNGGWNGLAIAIC